MQKLREVNAIESILLSTSLTILIIALDFINTGFHWRKSEVNKLIFGAVTASVGFACWSLWLGEH